MTSRLTVVLVSLLLALPAVILWLWLVILPARVSILCSKECLCETGGYIVKCDGTSLTAVPLIHLTDVRDLWFVSNKIKVLGKDSFVSLTELEELIFRSSGLRTMELGAFNGLTKLTRLFIVGNEICEIIPGTFENMISLEILDLSRNRIEHVDRDMFSGLFKLKYIDLSENKLQYLHPDAFLKLPNLQKLYFNENPGLQIPTDRNIIKSHSLSVLGIRSSNVSSVSVETFANVSSLEWLDLSDNNLRTVNINILRALPKLSALYLYGNPLECDYKNYTDTKTWYSYENSHNSNFLKHYDIPIYAVPFSIGTTGNLILLIIIIRNKDMRTLPNIYILNLAISDIIYLTVFFSEACVNRELVTWPNGDFACTIIPFCRRLSVGLSAYSVAVLSIQRYRATVNPFHARVSSPPTWRGTVATIFGVWIVAILFAIPSTISNDFCVEWTFLNSTTYYHRVVIFELLASCVLPLCVIAFTYIMTARHLVKSSRSVSEGKQNPQLETRRNSAKIVVGLTVVFLISYVPYHVFWTYIIWTQHVEIIFTGFNSEPKYAMQYLISTCFLLINSCINPVALFCTSSPFRQHLKRYLTCCCKRKSPSTDLELTRRK